MNKAGLASDNLELFGLISDTLVVVNSDDFKIQYINKPFLELTEEELIGKCLFDYFSEETIQILEEFLLKLKRQSEAGSIELSLAERAYITRGKRIQDDLYLFLEDVSSRRSKKKRISRLENQLNLLNRKHTATLDNFNRELNELIYVLNHDLKTPLAYTKIFVDLLKRQSDPAKTEQVRYIEKIQFSLKEFSFILNALEDFLIEDEKPVTLERVGLRQLVYEVCEEIENKYSRSKFQFSIESFPESITADRSKIHTLLYSLLDNAAKFSQDEKVSIIHLNYFDNVDEHFISIRDNGVGFNTRYAQRLFQPLQRLHHSDEFKGRGIQLAICDRIVKQHRGVIFAHAREGQGALFCFSLDKNLV